MKVNKMDNNNNTFRNDLFERNRCLYIQESIYQGEKVNKSILKEAVESIYGIDTSDVPNSHLTESSTMYLAHIMISEGVKDIDKYDILKGNPRSNPDFEVMYNGLKALISTKSATLEAKENAKKLLDIFGKDCLTSSKALNLVKTAHSNNNKKVRLILNSIYSYWLYLGTKTLVGSLEIKSELSLSSSDVINHYFTKTNINSLIDNTDKLMKSSGKHEEFLVGAMFYILFIMVDIIILVLVIKFFLWAFKKMYRFISSNTKDIIETATKDEQSSKEYYKKKKIINELEKIESHNKEIDKEVNELLKKKIKQDSGSDNPAIVSSSHTGRM